MPGRHGRHPPLAAVGAFEVIMSDNVSYLTQIHLLLNQHFSLAEVQNLCFQLSIDYESVPGDEKSSRIRALLLGLGRNGRLPHLTALAQQLRVVCKNADQV